MTIAPLRRSIEQRRALRETVIAAATELIAAGGLRHASLRAVAEACGVPIAMLVSLFGTKDDLILACYEAVIDRDRKTTDALMGAFEMLGCDPELVGGLLWTIVESAAGIGRSDAIILVELWLEAQHHPELQPVLLRWLIQRRDGFRAIGRSIGGNDHAFDILALLALSESCFAISCHSSAAWRVVARAGFEAVAARLTGVATDIPDKPSLTCFHIDPVGHVVANPPPGSKALGRQLLVDGAADIIMTDGLSAVTNRAVAARSGLSLAATTYHFRTISDIALAGIVRVFERINDIGVATPALPPTSAGSRAWISARSKPDNVQLVATRGMAEVSLADARGMAPAGHGLSIRRQRGTITQAWLKSVGFGDTSRLLTASHALWYSAVFLCVAATPSAEDLFDFDRQAELLGRSLFGFTN